MSVQRGTRLVVFDAEVWSPVGDQGDNSQFWKPATVERVYFRQGDGYLIDVRFDDNRQRVSHGHFLRMTKPFDYRKFAIATARAQAASVTDPEKVAQLTACLDVAARAARNDHP
ncbi:MAG: hypothetical protein V1790_17440 [Planctomycetota bacterium]